MKKIYNLIFLLACIILPSGTIEAQDLLAFPGADGYGKYTTGGRGGEVCYVTRTDDCTDDNLVEGTLRWALRHDNGGKPRTVLFNVSGTIYLTSVLKLQYPDVSILGQSAPGGGVCIAGYNIYICQNNVIVRYIRFRAGDIPNTSMTGLDMENCENVIIDHCSMTWSMEECLTAYDSKYTTVQWCIIGEGLYSSKNAKGARAYAMQWGGEHSTMHHTLITNSHSRSPRFNGVRSTGTGHDKNVDSEFANNVVFNWSTYGSIYGGENYQACNGYDRVYMINNYYRPGPSTKLGTTNARYFVAPSVESSTGQYGEWYLEGNKFEVDGTYSTKTGVWSSDNLALVNADNYYGAVEGNSARAINLTGDDATQYLMSSIPYDLSGLTYETADDAFTKVTSQAGASLPRYDEVDQRLLDEAAGRIEPRFVGSTLPNDIGIIDSPDDITLTEHDTYVVDGVIYTNYPFLGMRDGDKYMIDSDADGLPDSYEEEIGLDPLDATDAAQVTESGYTYLENYLNGIADGTILKSKYETSDFVVEPGLATRPETVTYEFSCTDDEVEGTLPVGGTVAYGAEVTIPLNTSLYKDGYTLSSWTANSMLFEPGKTYNISSDLTLTPVFTQNRENLDDRSKETTATWDFTLDNAPELSAEGGSGIYVNQIQVDDYTIDAKISYSNTEVTVPWCEGATVKVNGNELTAEAVEDSARIDVAGMLPVQEISVTLPYIRKITVDTYHEAAVTDLQNYEIVMTDSATIESTDWMEINEDYSQKWTSSYCYDPVADDGTKDNYYNIPKVNATLGYLRMYITKTDKMRIFASGRSSVGDRLLVTAVPNDGSGSISAQGNLVTKGYPDVFEMELDPDKYYTVTFTSVNGNDMTLNAVKLYYGDEPVVTSGDCSVTWPFSGTVDIEGTQTPSGVFSSTSVTVGSALTQMSGTAFGESYAEFQPASQISEPDDDNAIVFDVQPATDVYFCPQSLSFHAVRFGTDTGIIDVTLQQGNNESVKVLSNFVPNRNNSTAYSDVSIDLSDYDFTSSGDPVKVRIDIYGLSNVKQVGLNSIVLSGTWSGDKPEINQYTFSAVVSPADAASVSWTPDGDIFDENTKITVSLTPTGSYLFENWTNQNDEVVSTTENFTYTINENTVLTANYRSYDDYSYIFDSAPYDAAVSTTNELKVALAKAAERSGQERYRIFLYNGTYDFGTTAKNEVPGGVSLVGESQDGVIITNTPESSGADASPTLFIDVDQNDVYMQDLTVRQGRDWETKVSTGQAMAIRQRGKRAAYKNVTLQGVQDTYYINKGDASAYFETSTICGQTDYIYGDGTVWLEKCNIYNTGAGYIAAPNTQAGYWGIVFNECVVDGADAAAGNFYLGRPWGDSPHATYLNTTFRQLPVETGWAAMTSGCVLRFHEYGSMDADGSLIDLSQRSVSACDPASGSDSPVLTAEEAAEYTLANVFDGWDPQSLTIQLSAPSVIQSDEHTLSWQAVPDAIGYAVVKDGSVIGFTVSTTFDTSLTGSGTYCVRAANEMGGLGATSNETTGIGAVITDGLDYNSPMYSISGQRVSKSFKGIVIQKGKKYVKRQ